MMSCDDCAFAEWNRTKSGRLHPSKMGKCARLSKHPLDLRLPEAFYWPSYRYPPKPCGGAIERGVQFERCDFKHRAPAQGEPT